MLNELFIDTGFLKTMDVKLLKGRNFENTNEFKTAYIINETAERELGWADALGKKIAVPDEKDAIWGEGTIVGVVKDFNTRSLHKKIEPLVLRLQYDSWPGYCLNVRHHGSEKDVLASIKKVYEQVLPGFLMDYDIVSQRYDSQYQNERKAHEVLRLCTWIIVIISCLGIFSMSVFLSTKRLKEFGIRKVLGATIQQIMGLHLSQFFKTAVLANLIALPFAFWFMEEWLSGFAYKVEFTVIQTLLVGSILFSLVILSAGYSAWKTGRMNPVDVIKME
jgi:putative ABC transport system permease protein